MKPGGIGNRSGMHRDQARDVRVRLLERHARFQPGHALIAEVADEQLGAVEAEGEDELRVAIEEAEAGGQHADDLAAACRRSMTDLPTMGGSLPNLRCQ